MEQWIDVNGTKLWTDARGKNVQGYVMLCNGGPGSCDYLRPISEMIEDGYRVIRFEQRGCGRSDPDGNYDIATTLSDLEVIRGYYQINHWIIGGHSWGANLALMYALAYPKQTEAVLYLCGNGFQRNREWSQAYHENRERLGEEMPSMQFEGSVEVNRAGNASYKEYIQGKTLLRDIARLENKILFLCGEQDPRPSWPVEQLYYLTNNSKLVYIKNAAHYAWLQQPEEVRKQLRYFLNLSDSPIAKTTFL